MFSSHEQEQDYTNSISSLIQLCTLSNVHFKPSFIVIDACKACLNAIKLLIPNAKVIMCWFHLMYNVKKHLKKLNITDLTKKKIIKSIYKMRESKSFRKCAKAVLNRWKQSSVKSIKLFAKYFHNQWIKSDFSNWNLYETPAGYSMSNSPIESFNNTIKRFFTHRNKYHLLPVLKIFEENIKVESLKKFDYKEYKRATSGLIQVAKKALKIENKLVQIDNKELDGIVYNVFEYNHSNGSKCLIEINPEDRKSVV